MSEDTEAEEATAPTQRISSFVFAVILITLVLSLAALYFALSAYNSGDASAGILLIIGFIGLGLSTYMLLQTRRSVMRLALKIQPVITTISCQKCGFKNVREFERGDFVFKEVGPCPKCNDKLLVSAIYREIKEKPKEERF
ncbi:MAG: hypothetical protein ACQXXH_06005 [Candidatus Bathyarchaeia archaeon]|jgi:DNA-directed RNA polymerase subunit RPC12/RpoP|nr:hypothetical protein [Candidatus Bathyarchaeota archaeon A05DMB-4]MDH7595349.1 hypothetical protein [Candidatus Bathyarchaeota archaeon]